MDVKEYITVDESTPVIAYKYFSRSDHAVYIAYLVVAIQILCSIRELYNEFNLLL